MSGRILTAVVLLTSAMGAQTRFERALTTDASVPSPLLGISAWQIKPGIIHGHSREGVTQPGPAGQAQVKTESTPVYRIASGESVPIAVLKKGVQLWIDFEVKNARQSWCRVKQTRRADDIGYVHCSDLERVTRGSGLPPSFSPFAGTAR